ncbi:hypothetical protein SAMN05216410_0257 [Sanguibacter gelidistatuariae]|uniref:Uncharacterized protein n=1 Tax=Sanguibacter gelidistatuariae TaxID=1814289 RepID=A0A1G6Y1H6_9MICO|nr:hypothetical protein [Sanguibacter gelidistatuariae]SDD84249.1 hypothetical protein SAMN05216410_0257 [Sanguibacter gelidistatuariae]
MTDTAAPSEGGSSAITVASIEAKLALGAAVDPTDVAWLLHALRVATAEDATPRDDDAVPAPSREQLIVEFKLGPTPSPDMLAYLADYVAERAAEEAEDGVEES